MNFSTSIQTWFFGLLTVSLLSISSAVLAQEDKEQYRIKVGDTVQIQVIGEEELTVDVPVNETGIFLYPLLGEIELIDKTIVDIQNYITEGLRGDYLLDPKVNVNVELAEVTEEELAAEQPEGFYINGEVVSNGQFVFQKGLTVNKAIVLAGGFTERAARKKVTVISNEGDQKPKRVKLDYILKPGDIINVPRRFF